MNLKQKQINAKPVRHAVYSGIVKRDNKTWLGLFNKIIFLFLAICGVYSILCLNDLAIKGFVMRELKLELAELNRMNEANELAVMELESYENINQKAQELKMVKADAIEYISAGTGSFAKK
jgi:hypothetical protein